MISRLPQSAVWKQRTGAASLTAYSTVYGHPQCVLPLRSLSSCSGHDNPPLRSLAGPMRAHNPRSIRVPSGEFKHGQQMDLWPPPCARGCAQGTTRALWPDRGCGGIRSRLMPSPARVPAMLPEVLRTFGLTKTTRRKTVNPTNGDDKCLSDQNSKAKPRRN
jgi:hypothetical protein